MFGLVQAYGAGLGIESWGWSYTHGVCVRLMRLVVVSIGWGYDHEGRVRNIWFGI